MKILHTSAELYPYIKVGGLSDMLASIAKEQANRHEVHIAVPLLKSFRDKIPEVV
ncbi:MAG TPA: glycogen/starch synthase, partial [Leptospiraceae bacterium]|nr:glycogen/starch synthase [Leptospiraceae bacterium]